MTEAPTRWQLETYLAFLTTEARAVARHLDCETEDGRIFVAANRLGTMYVDRREQPAWGAVNRALPVLRAVGLGSET